MLAIARAGRLGLAGQSLGDCWRGNRRVADSAIETEAYFCLHHDNFRGLLRTLTRNMTRKLESKHSKVQS